VFTFGVHVKKDTLSDGTRDQIQNNSPIQRWQAFLLVHGSQRVVDASVLRDWVVRGHVTRLEADLDIL